MDGRRGRSRGMKLVVDVPDEEFELDKFLFDGGMGSAAIRRILDGKPYEECRWIPITERMPEESYDSVIGWDAQRDRCVFVQFYNGQFQISGSNETFDITHWMPMLTPPYERSKEDAEKL